MALFTNDKNCISTGLRADIMRSSMEDKNLLEGQGSIYVGTGTKNTLDDGTTQVMKTKELKVDSTAGKVLMSSGSDLVYSTLLNSSFSPSTQYPNLKLISGTNGSSISGITLAQDGTTGYLSLSGYISKLTSSSGFSYITGTDDAILTHLLNVNAPMELAGGYGILDKDRNEIVTADGKFYGQFYPKVGGSLPLVHVYRHHITLTLSTNTTLDSSLRGAAFSFEVLNHVATKLTTGMLLCGYIRTGYISKTTDGTKTYINVYTTPSGIYLQNNAGSTVSYVRFSYNIISATESCGIYIRKYGGTSDTTVYSNSGSGVEIDLTDTIKDEVSYLDTGEYI